MIDVVRGWEAPFNPARVVREVFDVLHGYRVSRVCGDRYAGELPDAEFRRYGVRYETASKPKSDLYLDLLAALNSDLVALPDDSELVRQLCALQRHVRQGGREKVDPPYALNVEHTVAWLNHVHPNRPLLVDKPESRPGPDANTFALPCAELPPRPQW